MDYKEVVLLTVLKELTDYKDRVGTRERVVEAMLEALKIYGYTVTPPSTTPKEDVFSRPECPYHYCSSPTPERDCGKQCQHHPPGVG